MVAARKIWSCNEGKLQCLVDCNEFRLWPNFLPLYAVQTIPPMLKSVSVCRKTLIKWTSRPTGARDASSVRKRDQKRAPISLRRISAESSLVSRFGCRNYSLPSPPPDFDDIPPLQMDGLDPDTEYDAALPILDDVIPPLGTTTVPLVSNDNQTQQTLPSAKPAFQGHRHRPGAVKPSLNANSKAPGTFVSSYYKIDESNLTSYLNRKNIAFKQNAQRQLVVRECPFCHDTKAHPSNLWKLYIYMENGNYMCFRCSAQGSWYESI